MERLVGLHVSPFDRSCYRLCNAKFVRQFCEKRAEPLRVVNREDIYGLEPTERDHLQRDVFIHRSIWPFP